MGYLKQNQTYGAVIPINMILIRTNIEFDRSDFLTETSTVFWPEITFNPLYSVIGQAHVIIMEINNIEVTAYI